MDFKNRLRELGNAFCAVLIPMFVLFVYGGITSYINNISEMPGGIYSNIFYIIKNFLIFWCAGGFGVFIISTLNKFIFNRLISVLVLIGFALFVQGNIFSHFYSVVDGRDIIELLSVRSGASIILWLGCIGISLVFYKEIVAHIRSISFIFICVLSLGIIMEYKSNIEVINKYRNNDIAIYGYKHVDLAEFGFSPDKNVIFIVLDTFTGHIAKEIFKDKEYRDIFKGFRHLTDYSAVFPTTYPSITALLTGKMYDNSIPIYDFFVDTKEDTIQFILKKHGFRSTLNTLESPIYMGKDVFDNVEDSPVPVGNKTKLVRDVFFKYLPHVLKKMAYETTDMEQKWDLAALRLLNDREFQANNQSPYFKLFHFRALHPPMVVDESFNYQEAGTGILPQGKASLRLVEILLHKMKKIGVFDNSLIVITADHSAHIRESENILGLIKFPGVSDELDMIDDNTPLSMTDIKDTVLRSIELGNNTLIPNTKRIFRYYTWDDGWEKLYLPEMTEYSIIGHSLDMDAYVTTGKTYLPPLQIFDEDIFLKFPQDFNGVRNCYTGFVEEDKRIISPDSVRFKSFSANIMRRNGYYVRADMDIVHDGVEETVWNISDSHAIEILFPGKEVELKSLSLTFHPKKLEREKPIDFRPKSLGACFLGNGWLFPETWGVWSDREHAVMKLPLPVGTRYLRYDIQIFATVEIPRQRGQVYVDGHHALDFSLSTEDKVLWIPLPEEVKDPAHEYHVEFFLPDANTSGETATRLGLGIKSLTPCAHKLED